MRHGKASSVAGPSAPTMSRSRYKLDVMAMYARQYYWCCEGVDGHVLSLCHLAVDLVTFEGHFGRECGGVGFGSLRLIAGLFEEQGTSIWTCSLIY